MSMEDEDEGEDVDDDEDSGVADVPLPPEVIVVPIAISLIDEDADGDADSCDATPVEPADAVSPEDAPDVAPAVVEDASGVAVVPPQAASPTVSALTQVSIPKARPIRRRVLSRCGAKVSPAVVPLLSCPLIESLLLPESPGSPPSHRPQLPPAPTTSLPPSYGRATRAT